MTAQQLLSNNRRVSIVGFIKRLIITALLIGLIFFLVDKLGGLVTMVIAIIIGPYIRKHILFSDQVDNFIDQFDGNDHIER